MQIMAFVAASLPTRGAYHDRHDTWGAGCGGRFCSGAQARTKSRRETAELCLRDNWLASCMKYHHLSSFRGARQREPGISRFRVWSFGPSRNDAVAELSPSKIPLEPAQLLRRKSKDKLMNILPGNLRFGAGQPVKRLEDQRLLTGKGQFIDDKPDDGALWLHVLRSPHAHAKIKSINIKAAAEMPGVEAVYTGADLVKDNIGALPTLDIFKRPDGSPMTVPPRRLLAHEVVRFAGEAVAAVVAKSRLEAPNCAAAIAVDH